MSKMKYIVFECSDEERGTLLHIPVIFPHLLVHSEVAELISCLRVDPTNTMRFWMHPVPVSAGFISGSKCYGMSESLGLKSHPDDTAICSNFESHNGAGFARRIKDEPNASHVAVGRRR